MPLAALNLVALVGLAIALAIAAGTQKIAMGGLAIEALDGAERAAGNAALGGGSALGSIAGTIGLVWLHASQGWTAALLAASFATLGVGIAYLGVPRTASGGLPPIAPPSLRRLFRQASTWRRVGGLVLVGLPLGLPYGLVQPRLADAGLDVQTIGLVSGLGQLAMWIVTGPLVTLSVDQFGSRRTQAGTLLASGGLFACAAVATFASPSSISAAILSGCAAIAALVGVSIATYTEVMRDAERGDQAATEFSVYLSLYGLVILCKAGLSGFLADLSNYASVLSLAAVIGGLSAFVLSRAR